MKKTLRWFMPLGALALGLSTGMAQADDRDHWRDREHRVERHWDRDDERRWRDYHDDRWDDRRKRWDDRRGPEHAYGRVPPGHLPPPGECRIWYPDRPPGHQPPPGDCWELRRHLPYGAAVIRG